MSPCRASAAPLASAPTMSRARLRAAGGFDKAALAATRAVEFASWRPEAVEGPADLVEDPLPLRIPVEFDAPMVEPTLPPVEVVRGRPPGPITALCRPAPPMRAPPVPNADRPLRDLVLEALADGPLNTMSLAYRLDRKEMPISSTLTVLEHEGQVRSEPVEGGVRRLVWMLAERAA